MLLANVAAQRLDAQGCRVTPGFRAGLQLKCMLGEHRIRNDNSGCASYPVWLSADEASPVKRYLKRAV